MQQALIFPLLILSGMLLWGWVSALTVAIVGLAVGVRTIRRSS